LILIINNKNMQTKNKHFGLRAEKREIKIVKKVFE